MKICDAVRILQTESVMKGIKNKLETRIILGSAPG